MVDNSQLFEKYKLNNNVEVPSRLAVAPMVIFGSDDSGQITDEERSYLQHRATGIDLYILGAVAVSVEGIGIKSQGRSFSYISNNPFWTIWRKTTFWKDAFISF